MSSTLMWRPANSDGNSLPYDLKKVISRRLWDTDGSCGSGVATVNETDIEYLEGLQDAGIDGASELIKIIQEHGDVQLWHEY